MTEAGSALVPLDDRGTFLVFGERLPGVEIAPLMFVPDAERRRLEQALVATIGLANVGAQLAQGMSAAQGVVRLGPETLQALQAGAQVVAKDGYNLGALVTQGGQFSHSVRWTSAGSASATSVLATVGPAVALLAIQWQLGRIEKLAQRNLALTQDVRGLLEAANRWELGGHSAVIRRTWEDARAVGSVPSRMWGDLQAQGTEAALEKHRGLAAERTSEHLEKQRGLKKPKERRDWLVERGTQVLADAHAVLEAEQAYCMYRALQAASLAEAADEATRAYAERLIDSALDQHEQALTRLEGVLLPLHTHLRLAAVCDDLRPLRSLGTKGANRSARAAAAALAEQIEAWLPSLAHRAANPEPGWGWLGELREDQRAATQRDLSERLAWVLDPDERVLTVLHGSTNGWGYLTWGHVVMTDRRVLMCQERPFARTAAVDEEVAWTSIRALETQLRGAAGGPDLILQYGPTRRHIQLKPGTTHDDVVALRERLVPVMRGEQHRPELTQTPTSLQGR